MLLFRAENEDACAWERKRGLAYVYSYICVGGCMRERERAHAHACVIYLYEYDV